jgi:two-component system cell cycle sensor histidine kinase/response regulator CckA
MTASSGMKMDPRSESGRVGAATTINIADPGGVAVDLIRLIDHTTHELNNVFGVILNYSALLTTQVVDPVAASDVREIASAARVGVDLINAVHSLTRLGDLQVETFDLSALVRELAEPLASDCGAGVALDFDLDSSPTMVQADREAVEQVLLQLCANAGEAMPGGGTVRIWTRLLPRGRPPAVVLGVTDTGSGIPAAVAGRVFEPFVTTKHGRQGRGMGLAVVAATVRRFGGSVEITATSGAGTAVEVRMPAAQAGHSREASNS